MKLIAWREEGERLDTQYISVFSDWRYDLICFWFKLPWGAWHLYIRRRTLTYRYQINKPAFHIEYGYV